MSAVAIAPAVAPVRLCRDCKHCMVATGDEYRWAECGRSSALDPVTGQMQHVYCRTERRWGACGDDAKLFEPRT